MTDQEKVPFTQTVCPQCYVESCGNSGFGTIEQLHRGMMDHCLAKSSEDVLLRIMRAWREMTQASLDLPYAYKVRGEWLPIIENAFLPLINALNNSDLIALDEVLRNFFRIFGDYFGEPTDVLSEANKPFRLDRFRVYSSRWIELYGESSLPDVRSPLIGNPMGFMIEGMLFTHVSFIHNHFARRIEDLCSDMANPVICEIGGGWGGLAYHLFNRNRYFRYVDYDIPLISTIAAYYLLTAFPERRVGLYGDIKDLAHPLDEYDIVVLPNFAIRNLQDQSADVCFNQCSFAEMDEVTVREYMMQSERICRNFIFHENHAWTSGSKNAGYEAAGGFKHWDLSKVEPSPARFKRLYKIPAPFHSDFRAEFFEWLYVRK